MSLAITSTIKNELLRNAPRFVRQGVLYKNFYNADTRVAYDITSRVVSWGTLLLSSSLCADDMEKPGVTVELSGSDNYLNKYYATSWWAASPAMSPKDCVYVFDLYVLTGSAGTREHALSYAGRVLDARVVKDRYSDIIELETVSENTRGVVTTLQKLHGGMIERPYPLY
jgi:hypothetical protein